MWPLTCPSFPVWTYYYYQLYLFSWYTKQYKSHTKSYTKWCWGINTLYNVSIRLCISVSIKSYGKNDENFQNPFFQRFETHSTLSLPMISVQDNNTPEPLASAWCRNNWAIFLHHSLPASKKKNYSILNFHELTLVNSMQKWINAVLCLLVSGLIDLA